MSLFGPSATIPPIVLAPNPLFVVVQAVLIFGGILWTHVRHGESLVATAVWVAIQLGLSILIRPLPSVLGAGLALGASVYYFFTTYPFRDRRRLWIYPITIILAGAFLIFPQTNIMWAFLTVTVVADLFEHALAGQPVCQMFLVATPFVFVGILLHWYLGFFILGVVVFRAAVAPILDRIARRLQNI